MAISTQFVVSNLTKKQFAGKKRWPNLMTSHELYSGMYDAAIAYHVHIIKYLNIFHTVVVTRAHSTPLKKHRPDAKLYCRKSDYKWRTGLFIVRQNKQSEEKVFGTFCKPGLATTIKEIISLPVFIILNTRVIST